MSLGSPAVLVAAAAYLAAIAALGVWAARRTRTALDFFVAGRGLGLGVTALATMSAAFSGVVFLGGPGLTYRIGVSSLFIFLPVGFTAGLLCWSAAKRLRLLAETRDVLTVPDAIEARFGGRVAAGLAAVAIVVGSVAYLGAQILAMGLLIEAILGTRTALGPSSLPLAMAIGLAVVLGYSVAGGMVAGVYTDVVQGLLMIATAVAVFAVAVGASGGVGAMLRSIAGSDRFGEAFLAPLGRPPGAAALGFFLVFGVGVLGQPQMLHKFLMLRDPRKLRYLPLALGGAQSLCLLVWLGIGLAVPALVAQGRLAPLASPDDATPAFLAAFAPSGLAGLTLAGALAAIMSTADSFVNLGSAALVRDLPRALGFRVREELRWGRIASAAVGVAAAVFAWGKGDLVALLGTFAFGTFGAALAPTIAIGMNWKRVPARAAAASIATGTALNLGLEALARGGALPLAPGVQPTALALAGSFLVLLVVTVASRPAPLPRDVDVVLDL